MSQTLYQRVLSLTVSHQDTSDLQRAITKKLRNQIQTFYRLWSVYPDLQLPEEPLQAGVTRGPYRAEATWPPFGFQDRNSETLHQVAFQLQVGEKTYQSRTSIHHGSGNVFWTHDIVQNPMAASALYHAMVDLAVKIAQFTEHMVEHLEHDPEVQRSLHEVGMLRQALDSSPSCP
jgi:hypothetical protein